ncbi:MAG: YajQ family cyclic di-GMP-binding protein [Nitrospirae bacterium GWC1_57_7]|nr:MAG: YajQ family cyclic di-GMP-binding protein [Bdellovibrionales bacterium GWB1_52_6]OFZ04300.1 MAG: YajQ family cyclic di-GMP-binding protein [Bdellovibrionales bacterium GWA1_52_35]OGW18937.1 MAG: YajQ family cyclic di-GMP-binding protein [Nitrospirae bacterium GWC1_57_7]HCM40851.1 YajQ family cyclic di-GMP-binding protein [Bdellovibrionales bacterium]
MPSFDISSEMDWQEVDNAINQAGKELSQRFDFKGVKSEIKLDQKAKTITLWCSEEGKLDSLNDILQNKLVKRGISLLSLDYGTLESAFGGSVRQVVTLQAGISKEKAKEIIAALKESRLKVQAQIQDEQVRVTGKNRDDLQSAIAVLKEKQDGLKVPMQFGNFRE